MSVSASNTDEQITSSISFEKRERKKNKDGFLPNALHFCFFSLPNLDIVKIFFVMANLNDV